MQQTEPDNADKLTARAQICAYISKPENVLTSLWQEGVDKVHRDLSPPEKTDILNSLCINLKKEQAQKDVFDNAFLPLLTPLFGGLEEAQKGSILKNFLSKVQNFPNEGKIDRITEMSRALKEFVSMVINNHGNKHYLNRCIDNPSSIKDQHTFSNQRSSSSQQYGALQISFSPIKLPEILVDDKNPSLAREYDAGLTLQKQGNHLSAIAAFENVSAIINSSRSDDTNIFALWGEALLSAAWSYNRLGNVEHAKGLCQTVLTAAQAKRDSSRLSEAARSYEEYFSTCDTFDQGVKLYEEHKYEDSAAAFRSLANAKFPKSIPETLALVSDLSKRSQEFRAFSLMGLGKNDDAILIFDELFKSPDVVPIKAAISQPLAYSALNALSEFNQKNIDAPSDLKAMLAQGFYSYAMGNYPQAELLLDTASKISVLEKFPCVHGHAAILHASSQYEPMHDMSPYLNKILTYQEDYMDSTDLKKAKHKAKYYNANYYNDGEKHVRRSIDLLDKGGILLDQHRKIFPENHILRRHIDSWQANARFNLAVTLQSQEKIHQSDPSQGQDYEGGEKHKEAENLFQSVIDGCAKNPSICENDPTIKWKVHLYRSMSLHELGEKAEALKSLQEALDNPDMQKEPHLELWSEGYRTKGEWIYEEGFDQEGSFKKSLDAYAEAVSKSGKPIITEAMSVFKEDIKQTNNVSLQHGISYVARGLCMLALHGNPNELLLDAIPDAYEAFQQVTQEGNPLGTPADSTALVGSREVNESRRYSGMHDRLFVYGHGAAGVYYPEIHRLSTQIAREVYNNAHLGSFSDPRKHQALRNALPTQSRDESRPPSAKRARTSGGPSH